MVDDLHVLLAQVKQDGLDRDPADPDPDLIAKLKEHGTAALGPLLDLLDEVETENEAGLEQDSEVWNFAYVHIVNMLVELGMDQPAISRLYDLFEKYDEDEWLGEEVISELPKLGETVLAPSLDFLRDRSRLSFSRIGIAEILHNIAEKQPELREQIADGLADVIEAGDPDDETEDDQGVNSMMISALAATQVERYAPLIEKLYAEERVDPIFSRLEWDLAEIQGQEPDYSSGQGERSESLFETLFGQDFPDFEDDDQPPGRSSDLFTHDSVTPYVAPKRPGRNDPCWCGSGKKYKKCHMRQDQEEDRRAQ